MAARMRVGSPTPPGSSSGAGLWRCRGDERLLSLERGHGTKVHLARLGEAAALRLRGAPLCASRVGQAGWIHTRVFPVQRARGRLMGRHRLQWAAPEPGLSPGCRAPHPRSTPYALYFCPLVTKWQVLGPKIQSVCLPTFLP